MEGGLFLFSDALEGFGIGCLHIHEPAGAGVALHPVAGRRLGLSSAGDGTIAVSVAFGRIGSHGGVWLTV